MSFLHSLASDDTTLLDIFKMFPETSRPLLAYHELLLRGSSPFTVAERELIAAYVSGLNACHYCHGIHRATAEHFGVPENLLTQLLEEPSLAPIDARMQPVLAFVKKLTLTPSRISPSDAEMVFAAGWNDRALYDAVSVCALFNFMNRLVEGVGVKGSPSYFKVSAERLASDGYLGLQKLLDR